MLLLVHTLIPALCSTLYLSPFLRRHPLQLIKNIPPHLTQKSTKCPGDSEKSEVKKTVLDHESININSEYLEKNLSEQGTEVTTNSNTAGRQVLSPLLKRKGAEVSFYLNYREIEKTVYLMLKKSVNSGLTMLSNNWLIILCQLQPGNMDSIVQAVKELRNICDAVDITDFSSSSISCSTDEDERWKSWLSCIHQIYQVCEAPLLCKLPFSQQTVDDTVRKGKSLQEAGCQVIWSEGQLI